MYLIKNSFFFIFLILVVKGFSQGLINNGAYLVMTSGNYIYVDGDANGGYTNEGTGYINSDGTLAIEGNWTNNGTTDVYTSVNSTGSTVFSGTTNQAIGGTRKTVFENININNSNSANSIYLSQDVGILYNLTMTSGKFDLKNKVADLGATGDIVNENETNRVTSTDASWVVGNNTGTITATRTVNNVTNYNPAHLGIEITTPNSLGLITIVRGHEIQTGSFGSGVARYYEVPGIGKLDVAGNISVNMYYWDAELNGLTESQLEGFHWVTEGSSSSWWTPLAGSLNTSSNLFTTGGNPYDNYFTNSTWYGFTWSDKFTLGSKDTPLPIELKSFTAECQDGGKLIKWITASEINNDYFTLEKSNDGKDFYSLATIMGAGNSNVENTYEYYDSEPVGGTVYYRLSQTDFNGDKQTFKIIAANCSGSQTTEDNFIIINNPAHESVQLQLTGTEGTRYILSFIDQLGRQLIEKKVYLENTTQTITVNTQTLSEGIYSVVFRSTDNIITKQLIITR